MPEPASEQSIFLNALALPTAAERAAYLDEVCRDNPGLRAELEALLTAHERLGGVLPPTTGEEPARVVAAASPPAPGGGADVEVGAVLSGRYKLVQQIGEGGMGSVWMARQHEPIKRLVALKVIKPGMDSKQVLARFEAERQALARMEHPNIARVLDAGTAASGQPYFVMELVKGVPLTKYCDEHRLTPRERLELFIPVCQAIQHAHQKGVIHRDIKPSNVLVALYDGRPVPKVIDFGIAKATGQQLTDHTLVTGFGAVVGTLQYMSPEQAELNQLDVDTRSDIYSLGVVLYELLTGSTPLQRKRLKAAAMLEILRLIREEEPPRPSTRLSATDEMPSVAANRGLEPKKLSGLVRGELDWIVMKALEKDRARRYETANGFAQDIQRYLADEPVQACPPRAGYRLRKFVRRNKGSVLAATVILLLLIGGVVGTTLGLLQAQTAEEHAQGEASKAGHERDQAIAARAAAQKAGEAEKVQRQLAEAATEAEKLQRKLVEERGKELRQNLYFAEMNLAGQAADSPLGLARVADLLSHWPSGQPDLRGWEWYYLHGLCHQDLLTISVASDGVYSVGWSPDGTRLATRSLRTAKVWDAVTGKEAVILAESKQLRMYAGFSIAWSPDGTLLASGTADSKNLQQAMITIWDAATGEQRLSFQGHTQGVLSVAWAPDSTRLASGGVDQTVKVWDASTGKATFILKGHTGAVNAVAWSRDGTRLASADESGAVKIWEGATGKEALNIRATQTVRTVAWSPDGNCLAVAGPSGGIQIWDTATAKRLRYLVPDAGTLSLSWSPDGKRLAVATLQGQVKIMDPYATGKATVTLRGHSHAVQSVAWSPDGTRLASASFDGTVGTVKVWDADKKCNPLPLKGHKGTVIAVSWNSNGKRLASASADRTVKIWDATTGNDVLTLEGHSDPVAALSWDPDNTLLASGGKDGMVKIWDAGTGKEFLTLKAHNKWVQSVAWSPDGTRLASADLQGMVKIWDPFTGKGLRTFTIDSVLSVSWSPDGTHLASASSSGIRIWDVATGKTSCFLKGHTAVATSVAWCPTGTRLASASQDRTIKIWDVATGTEILTLKGHTSFVVSVAWNSDGTRLASASSDGAVKIWHAATGKQAISLKEVGYHSVAWSPDGTRLATGDLTGKPIILDATNGYRLAGRSGPGDRSQPTKATGFPIP